MNKSTSFLFTLIFASAVAAGAGSEMPPPLTSGVTVQASVTDAQSPLPPGAVHFQGYLGQQLDLCITNRIAAQNVEELLRPFRERKDVNEWRSEFWGKWITSAIAAYRYTGDPQLKELIDRAGTGLLDTQTPDGYIGSYPDQGHRKSWDIWGRKYTLLGLLAWYDVTGDKKIMEAACRQADFLLSEVGPGKASPFENDRWHGLASSSVLEPMSLLYRHTGRPQYLEFCEYLVHQWPDPQGPDILRKALADVPVFAMFPGPKPVVKNYGDGGESKAYEMMSCFEGLTELYRLTGTPTYREAVRKVHDNIDRSEITIIGSGSDWERWCDGRRRQSLPWHSGMETCVTATWIKFSFQLLRLTGDPRYADEIEQAACNALLGAQSLDGTWWAGDTPLAGDKRKASPQCGMNMNCCVANGPRALLLLPQVAVTRDAVGPVINLYGQIDARVELPSGHQVRLEQISDYPQNGVVRIRLTPDQPETFTLKLRIPAWSEKTSLTINGRTQKVTPGSYAKLARNWRPGDEAVLILDMRARLVAAPGDPTHVAVTRGPLVLARDQRLESGDVDAPVSLRANRHGFIAALPETEGKPKEIWLAFKVPMAGTTASLPMCDFASAGKTWDRTSQYRVWMPLK